MGPQGARTTVLVAGGLMAVYVGLHAKDNPGGSYKALWAVGVLTLGLSLVADVAPQLAAPAALLLVLGAYLKHRGQLGKVIPTARKGG